MEEDPKKGPPHDRGVYWEAITAYSAIVAGADIVIMRHPESVKLFRQAAKDLAGGG
jgi:acetyl-CoA decarbonylase/synthase complex subunit delta